MHAHNIKQATERIRCKIQQLAIDHKVVSRYAMTHALGKYTHSFLAGQPCRGQRVGRPPWLASYAFNDISAYCTFMGFTSYVPPLGRFSHNSMDTTYVRDHCKDGDVKVNRGPISAAQKAAFAA